VLDFRAARLAVLACRFCGTSLNLPLSTRDSPTLDDVFRFTTDAERLPPTYCPYSSRPRKPTLAAPVDLGVLGCYS